MAVGISQYNLNPQVNGAQTPNGTQAPDANNGLESQDVVVVLGSLLRAYEQAKLQIEEKALQTSNQLLQTGGELSKMLQGNPLWEQANGNGPSGSLNMQDVKNFFFIIFKYLKTSANDNAQVQVAQAVNMITKESTIDVITAGEQAGLSEMQQKIHEAEEKESGIFGVLMKIVLPIVITVISIAAIICTAGVASPGAAAADSAGIGACEGAGQVTADVTLEEGGDLTAQNAAQMLSSGATPGVAGGVEMGTATSDGVMSSSAVVSDEAASQAEQSTMQAVKSFLSKTWQYALTTAKVLSVPALVAGGYATGISYIQHQETESENDATVLAQGQMTVSSAAVNGLQNDIQADMQLQQFAQSNQQAASSVVPQVIQSMITVMSAGNV